MSAISRQGEASISNSPPTEFVDWANYSEDEPTDEELRNARERMLNLGNRTEVHYKADEVSYNRRFEYRRLDRHNRDVHWKNRVDANVQNSVDKEYKLHVIRAIGGQLGLSDLQQQEAVEMFFALDLQRMGRQLEVIAFCVCSLVPNFDAVERYESGERVYHPQRKDRDNPDAFLKLQGKLLEKYAQFDEGDIQSIYQKLAHGNPPTRHKEEWESFIEQSAIVQRRPSYNQEGTVAPSKHPNQGE